MFISRIDAEVKRTICKGINNREAKQFALLSEHIPLDDFIEKLVRYDRIINIDLLSCLMYQSMLCVRVLASLLALLHLRYILGRADFE